MTVRNFPCSLFRFNLSLFALDVPHDCKSSISVDHSGVPNTQVLAEQPALSLIYNQRSVAEQNSLDLSWDLFMDERYSLLRAALFETPDDLKRFRQLVVNSVMATDIADKELKTLRNARWDKAFHKADGFVESERDGFNRKATIVIEHLIQAVRCIDGCGF